ncbi:MAG: GntR family transcriptional regulator [Caldilineales bacterium]|nr:GntR family transcriptional regulator [Caldilineales bacterium]
MSQITVRSKKEAVYDWILERIVNGAFAPNAPLVIDEISRTISVSQIPVREAFQQLEAEGFVVIRPYTGAVVADLQPSMIIEIFGFLEAAEMISGRMACSMMCEGNLTEIETQLQKMDRLLDDVDRWSEENKVFHTMICRCSGAILTEDILARMLLHWDRLRRHYLEDVFGKRIDKAHADHWKMFEAIKVHDPDKLEAIVREHNRSALQDYINYLQRSGFEIEQAAMSPAYVLEFSQP